MKYKLIPMKDGKVDLSINELSEMLEKAYNDGYKDGKEAMPKADIFEPADWVYKPDIDMFKVHYENPTAVWCDDNYKSTTTADTTTEYKEENSTFTKIIEDLLKK